MSRRPPNKLRDATPGITPVYEGPDVLNTLLARAGSPHGVEEVAAMFRRALAANEPRASVIPGLFPDEPRFDSPDGARRLYGNLFGLWARLAAGLGLHEEQPEVVPETSPLPPLPERGSHEGDELSTEIVDAVWRHLAAASPRELQRRRDRYANVQPDLAAWLDAAPLPESGALGAADLAFETWAMFDQAYGERLDAVDFATLRSLEKEPPALESSQPALAAYVAEQLDILADEDPAFVAAERAQVERVLATIAGALATAVRQRS
jgi:hypothetical protein